SSVIVPSSLPLPLPLALPCRDRSSGKGKGKARQVSLHVDHECRSQSPPQYRQQQPRIEQRAGRVAALAALDDLVLVAEERIDDERDRIDEIAGPEMLHRPRRL